MEEGKRSICLFALAVQSIYSVAATADAFADIRTRFWGVSDTASGSLEIPHAFQSQIGSVEVHSLTVEWAVVAYKVLGLPEFFSESCDHVDTEAATPIVLQN